MHRLKPLRWLVFVLGLGVALAIAGAGVRPGPRLEKVGGHTTDGTCFYPDANPPAGDYELVLDRIIPGRSAPYFIAGRDERGLPIFSVSHMTSTSPMRDISAWLFSATGETLAMLEDKWAVCPTGARGETPELLVWWPEWWYTPVHPARMEEHLIDRFRWNYSRDLKILRTNGFHNALRRAALGESLGIYSRLLAVVPGEGERQRIPVDPLYSADDGIVFRKGERHFGVLMTDGGYHNVDRFYMLLAQRALTAGSEYPLVGIDDIEGGYRGVFCVDLETGEKPWTNRTGVSPVRTHAADLDGDGEDELIVQTYCPENGVSGGGTTDAGSSYVLCMDQQGSILWTRRAVGVHLGGLAAAADVTGDGRNEVAIVWSSAQHMDMGYVHVMSGSGETLVERSDLGGLYGMVAADLDGDGASEIIAGGPESAVIALDGQLEVVRSFRDTVDFNRIPNWTDRKMVVPDILAAEPEQLFDRTIPLAAFDLDGDGELEVVCLSVAWAHLSWRSHNRRTLVPPRSDLVVLDSELREEARVMVLCADWGLTWPPFDCPASLKIDVFPADVDGDGVREVLMSATSRGLCVFRVAPTGEGA